MGRTPDSPESTLLRRKAFELFKETPQRAISDIAREINVSSQRCDYWRRADRWDEKLVKAGATVPATAKDIRELLRRDFHMHVQTLSGIINGPANDKIRVQAIKEYCLIAKHLGALDDELPELTNKMDQALDFNDDLTPEEGEPDGMVR